jgi:formate hydrogenlyase subunit 3/multisubunit Na+/H+ antiporter MnhD subunit
VQSDTAVEDGAVTGQAGLGRRIMLAVGGTVVLLSAAVGWFVGSNGSAELADAAVLGTNLTIPVTPLAVALYGVGISTLLLGGLFGLVELASRLEDDDVGTNESERVDRD